METRLKPSLDPRWPLPGTPLIRRFQGKDIIVHVRPDGRFECNGRIYTSLSRAVTEATGTRLPQEVLRRSYAEIGVVRDFERALEGAL